MAPFKFEFEPNPVFAKAVKDARTKSTDLVQAHKLVLSSCPGADVDFTGIVMEILRQSTLTDPKSPVPVELAALECSSKNSEPVELPVLGAPSGEISEPSFDHILVTFDEGWSDGGQTSLTLSSSISPAAEFGEFLATSGAFTAQFEHIEAVRDWNDQDTLVPSDRISCRGQAAGSTSGVDQVNGLVMDLGCGCMALVFLMAHEHFKVSTSVGSRQS